MEERPEIKPELTTTDKTIEFIGWLSIVAVWFWTINSYNNLPETIPTHFNGAGQADGFGGKGSILALPIIATILFIGMTILNNFPEAFNYPVSITQENALRQYTSATRMIRYLKLIIVIVFGLLVFKTINTANGQPVGTGFWFLPLILGLIFIPVFYFLIKSLRAKQ